MITSMTKEQEAQISVYRDKGLSVGHSTKPIDFEKAKELIKRLYVFIGQKPIDTFYFTSSPMEAQKLMAKLTGKNEYVPVCNYCTGSQESYWIYYYKYFSEVLNLEFNKKASEGLNLMTDIAENCGWFYMFDEACVIVDRPEIVSLNDKNEVHSTNGPSIKYRDGYSIYAIDGHIVPKKLVETPELLTIEEIKSEQNSEVKRIMMEIFGVSEYLVETGAKVVDVDTGLGLDGSAQRMLCEDDSGQKWLVGSDGSTKRVYHMAVPNDSKTCHEAHNQISGFSEDRLIAEA